jgi:OOP family OmpA-OmpF porin
MKWLATLVILLVFAAPAFADNERGLYAGAGVGAFFLKADTVEDITGIVSEFDSDDTSFKVFAGWRFAPYFAMEAAYIDFGGPDDDPGGVNIKAEIDGVAPYLIATLPLGPLELYARAGYMFYDLNVEVNGQEAGSVSGSDEDLIYGAGLGITLFGRINASLEYEKLDLSGPVDDADAVWLTGAWRF